MPNSPSQPWGTKEIDGQMPQCSLSHITFSSGRLVVLRHKEQEQKKILPDLLSLEGILETQAAKRVTK